MKNTFKFLALAFVAGALMLTACKKNNDEDAAAGTTVAVNFDGTQLPVGYTLAMAVQSPDKGQNYDFQLVAAKSGKIEGEQVLEFSLPYADMLFDNANRDYRDIDDTTGVWKTAHGVKWGIDALEAGIDTTYEIEVDESTILVYGDWTIDGQLKSFDITEFDATTMKMSYSTTAPMASLTDYFNDPADTIHLRYCTHKNLTINVANQNFPIVSADAKARLVKKIVK